MGTQILSVQIDNGPGRLRLKVLGGFESPTTLRFPTFAVVERIVGIAGRNHHPKFKFMQVSVRSLYAADAQGENMTTKFQLEDGCAIL